MNIYMNRTALVTFSCFDTGNKPSAATEPERFYHGFVLDLMVGLADRHSITSNRESGFGRYDVMLEPKKEKDKTAEELQQKSFLHNKSLFTNLLSFGHILHTALLHFAALFLRLIPLPD